LTACGQISSDIRAEFILLSDVLGLSALVDSMNHPVVPPATEGTVLGPFFTEDAKEVSLLNEPDPSTCFGRRLTSLRCLGSFTMASRSRPRRILDIDGNPVPNCKIETWETDDDGL
jgi:protocatechuate 3,4-dioxygenase beta subunit